jgi:hypothetical protein
MNNSQSQLSEWHLTHLLFVIGHVAIKMLGYVESLEERRKEQANEEEKKNEEKKK